MQEIELEEFLFGEWMILPIGYSKVFLGFFQVFFDGPTVFIELTDSIESIRKSAGFVELEGSLEVFRVALGAFAKHIGEIATGKVVAKVSGAFIPVHGLVDVFLDTYAIFEEYADLVGELHVVEFIVLFAILQETEHVANLLVAIAVIFGNGRVGENELPAIDRDHFDVFPVGHCDGFLFVLCKGLRGLSQMSVHPEKYYFL